MPKLSVIVPVFNVEQYLSECIDSILAQTMCDFELILIDDGSPDRCGEICDNYAQLDSRIIVIHQKNQGVSAARNAGLEIAKGEYIGFVDPDDMIKEDMYQVLIDTAICNNVDLVACGVSRMKEDNLLGKDELTYESEYNTQLELLKELFGMPNKLVGAVWNKIYKSKKIMNVRFKPGVTMGEDLLFLFDSFCELSSGIKISQALYIIRERASSVTRSNDIKKIYENIGKSRYELLKKARRYSFEVEKFATDRYLNDIIICTKELKNAGQHKNIILKLLLMKCRMIKVIFRAYCRHLLPKSKLHGYIFGLFNL